MNEEILQKIELLKQDFRDKKITHIQFVDGMADIYQKSFSESAKEGMKIEKNHD